MSGRDLSEHALQAREFCFFHMITLVFRTERLGFLPELRLPPDFRRTSLSKLSQRRTPKTLDMVQALMQSALPSRRNVSAALATAMAQLFLMYWVEK
jgi:hypothetical protein